jgi:hypothetical protein
MADVADCVNVELGTRLRVRACSVHNELAEADDGRIKRRP